MDFFIVGLDHLANLLKLSAFTVRDIMTLRWISVLASLMILLASFSQKEIIWRSIIYSLLFIVINAVMITLLYKENRSVKFKEEEKDLFLTVFQNFTPVEFMRIIKLGEWQNVSTGNVLIEEGERVKDIILIYKGSADIFAGDTLKATLLPDQFIGEMSYLTDKPAAAKVIAKEPMRVVRWSQEALKGITRRQPSLKTAFISLLSADLTNKLKNTDL